MPLILLLLLITKQTRDDVASVRMTEGDDENRNDKVVVKKNIERVIRKTIQEFKPSNKGAVGGVGVVVVVMAVIVGKSGCCCRGVFVGSQL